MVAAPYNFDMGGTQISEDDITPPHGILVTNHTILERAIHDVHQTLRMYIDEQREQAAKFYTTRMMPLEAQVVRLTTVAWLAVGIAGSALFLGAILMIAMIVR